MLIPAMGLSDTMLDTQSRKIPLHAGWLIVSYPPLSAMMMTIDELLSLIPLV